MISSVQTFKSTIRITDLIYNIVCCPKRKTEDEIVLYSRSQQFQEDLANFEDGRDISNLKISKLCIVNIVSQVRILQKQILKAEIKLGVTEDPSKVDQSAPRLKTLKMLAQKLTFLKASTEVRTPRM